VLLAAFLGLALAYAAFYAIFPNVSVPAGGEASFGLILAIFAAVAVLVGLETEDLPLGILEVFAAVPIGAVGIVALALSALTSGLVQARADELAFFMLRTSIPIFVFAMFMFLVCVLAGLWLRERLGSRWTLP
jgi:hypothetical protein